MNLGNYQAVNNPNSHNRTKSKAYPSISQQFTDMEARGDTTTVPSSVTICCRIKRPMVVISKGGETSILSSGRKRDGRGIRNQSVRNSA